MRFRDPVCDFHSVYTISKGVEPGHPTAVMEPFSSFHIIPPSNTKMDGGYERCFEVGRITFLDRAGLDGTSWTIPDAPKA